MTAVTRARLHAVSGAHPSRDSARCAVNAFINVTLIREAIALTELELGYIVYHSCPLIVATDLENYLQPYLWMI